VSSLIV
jgi:hypothetical protein